MERRWVAFVNCRTGKFFSDLGWVNDISNAYPFDRSETLSSKQLVAKMSSVEAQNLRAVDMSRSEVARKVEGYAKGIALEFLQGESNGE